MTKENKPWDKDEKLEAFRLLCECFCKGFGVELEPVLRVHGTGQIVSREIADALNKQAQTKE